MKLNKAFIAAALVLGSLLAGGVASQAQDNTNTPPAGAPPGGMRRGGPGMSYEAIAKRLEITDDQKPKAEPIITDFIQKVTDLRKDTSLSREDRMAKMKGLRDDATAKLKDILTADQLAKWQQMGTRRPGGAGGPGVGNPPPSGTPPAGAPPADAPKN
jgi:Spy/CpxP family protein refolding chaperone